MRQRMVGILTPESIFRLVLAFGLATALWLYVTSKQAHGFPFPQTIAVTAEGVGSGLTVENVLPGVHLTVNSSLVANLQPPGSFFARVVLTGLKSGHYARVPVDVHGPAVVGWSPRFVPIDIEREVSHRVPVRVVLRTPPPFGFSLRPGSIRTAPRRVTVTGAKTLVDPVSQAVVSLSLAQAKSSVEVDLVPMLENAAGRKFPFHLIVNPSVVRVRAGIVQQFSYKTVPVTASMVGSPGIGLGVSSIHLSPEFVTIYGPQSALRNMLRVQTDPINVFGLTSGMHRETTELRRLPHTVLGRRHVTVVLTVSPIEVATSTRVAVKVVGVPTGDQVNVTPTTILVTFSGRQNKLSAESRAIRAVVNASGLSRGSHVVSVRFHLPRGAVLASAQPSRVTLLLRK